MLGNKITEVGFEGKLVGKVVRAPKVGLGWKLRNILRLSFLLGLLYNRMAYGFSKLTGMPVLMSQLSARLIREDGTILDYGVICYRVITDTGVAFLVDDWDDSTTDITNMNYHASGTSGTAENQTDSALGAEATTVTDRVAGTKSQPAANQLRTVATQAFTGTAAIVEHGIFSVITESAGVLWDRSVFSAINVGNGDSIEWTYTCTCSAGS